MNVRKLVESASPQPSENTIRLLLDIVVDLDSRLKKAEGKGKNATPAASAPDAPPAS